MSREFSESISRSSEFARKTMKFMRAADKEGTWRQLETMMTKISPSSSNDVN